jgi:hypothetical protein
MLNVPKDYKGKPVVHSWTYYDKEKKPIGVVARYQNEHEKKVIVPYFKSDGSSSLSGINLNPRPLFGLNLLATHPKEKEVFIVEGEKSAAALQSLGICAVTSLGGAEAAKLADWTILNGFSSVYLLPDNDTAGEGYAQDVYSALTAFSSPPKVKLLRLPDLPEKGDIVDWLQALDSNWDGYAPIEDNDGGLKEIVYAELEKAEAVPDSWKATDSASDWENPNEISTKIPPVQPLSAELIPEPLKAWLPDVAHRMQTPPDFAGISAIVIMGSLIGAGCAIRPKQQDDWSVIPNLWGACIGRPSVMLKTPSMKEPMQLLERLQSEYGDRFESEKIESEFDLLSNKTGMEAIKAKLSKAAKSKGGMTDFEIQKLKAEHSELLRIANITPTRRLFKSNETSVQSMTVLQKQNPRGILVFRDELIALLAKWDREDGQEERAYFLEGWNGNGSYTDCKIGRGITDAKNICISLLGGIQPDKLNRYLYQAMRGNNDGLMQRLQLAVYPDEPENWGLIDSKPDKEAKNRVYAIIKRLADLAFTQHGACKDEDSDRPYFHFDDEAQIIFNAWLTELQLVKIKQEENPLMVEHLGKFRSLMPSLALIFHCIAIADGKTQGRVSAGSARLAVKWCEYLESHARRIYAMADNVEHATAIRLAEKIKSKKLPNPFTCKTVYDKGWHGLKEKKEIEAACCILEDENWLKKMRKPVSKNQGRPPLPEYYINPVFL